MIGVISFDYTEEVAVSQPIQAAIIIKNNGITPRYPVIETSMKYPDKTTDHYTKSVRIGAKEQKNFLITFKGSARAGKGTLTIKVRRALIPIFIKTLKVYII